MIALLSLSAFGADPVVDAVRAELDRASTGLKLPNVAGPYDIAAIVWDMGDAEVEATLGGIASAQANPNRILSVVVRSGSPSLDNTNFEVFPNGTETRQLVLDDNALAVRRDTWLVLDHAYKASVEALAAKTAADQRRAEPDDVPDFVAGPPQQADAAAVPHPDLAQVTELARNLSAVFLKHPGIEWSRVWIDAEAGRRVMLDTDGTRVVEPVSEMAVRVAARVRASDGMAQADGITFVVRDASQLPDSLRMVAQVEALAARLEAWRSLPALEEEYVGPVLFEDQAAVEVVRQLLAPALLGTPAQEDAPTGSRVLVFEDDEAQGPVQPKRRMLPSGWTVSDDPLRDPTRASAYHYDDEGRPARAVDLVSDGIVVHHLMSRIPNKWFRETNGHGRGQPGDLIRAVPADLLVAPGKVASPRSLHKTAIKLAAEYGSDHYVVVRRLQDPALQPFSGGALLTFGSTSQVTAPLEVVAVYKDGREVALRNAGLAGLDLRSFKELAGGGTSHTASLLWGDADWFSGPNVGFPVTFTVPSLLFSELVVTPDSEDAEKPPKLPSPLALGG